VKRRLFLILASVSFVLSVLTVALWMRSGYISDLWTWGQGSEEYWIRSDWGRLSVMRVSNATPQRSYETSIGGYSGANPGPITGRYQFLGVTYTWGRSIPGQIVGPTLSTTGSGPYWSLRVYHPLVIVLLGSPAMLYATLYLLRRHQNHRMKMRLAAMQCVACGYDLRATPDCCPECGILCDRNLRVTNSL
jgi:hypothetical protein